MRLPSQTSATVPLTTLRFHQQNPSLRTDVQIWSSYQSTLEQPVRKCFPLGTFWLFLCFRLSSSPNLLGDSNNDCGQAGEGAAERDIGLGLKMPKAPSISPVIHFRSGAEIDRLVLLKSKDIECICPVPTYLAGLEALMLAMSPDWHNFLWVKCDKFAVSQLQLTKRAEIMRTN